MMNDDGGAKGAKLRRPRWHGVVAIVAAGLAVVASWMLWNAGSLRALPKDLKAEFVGRQSCVRCHADQSRLFQGSHHDRAMDGADESTVLGNFDDVELEHLGEKATMFRRDGKFMVRTEGEQGTQQEFPIKYVFGFDPLQQYMVEFDRTSDQPDTEVARVQVLRWSWDTVAKKWLHLDPPDVHDRLKTTDPLHWTGSAQRWNTMCAECHSTHLVKGFDPKANRFHTTFSEIDVSCESCHGPGSIHNQLSSRWIGQRDPNHGTGLATLKKSAEDQIQACAPCHARRTILAAGFQAGDNYYDFYAESPLSPGIYFADGQVQDEDYIHGSFLQSKMYHKGIRCTDCHDPHSARLKHDGNQVCTSCHQHPTAKYDSVAHHFHKIGTPGSMCVDCHMPSTTYMAVDPRRDHSLRIPRPDLSLRLGTPNACTGCHVDRTKLSEGKREKVTQYLDWLNLALAGDDEIIAELQRVDRWCDEACDKWYGERRFREDTFAVPLATARKNQPEAVKLLQEWLAKSGSVSPAIARATMLDELSRIDAAKGIAAGRTYSKDEHPMVRRAAVVAMGQSPDPVRRVQLVRELLNDPRRSVRVEAARVVTSAGPSGWNVLSRSELDQAIEEFRASLAANNDQAGSHMGLGILDEQLGRTEAAIGHYEDALRMEPHGTGPRTNLAALLERIAEGAMNRDGASSRDTSNLEALKQRALKLRAEELPLLKRDAELLPDSADLQHRYGLALYLSGDLARALEQLHRASSLDPRRTDIGMAYALLLDKLNRREEARTEVRRLMEFAPEDAALRELLDSLR